MIKPTLVAMLAALALAGVAAYSWASSPARGHGRDPLGAIAGLRDQLKLNTSQQLQFDSALAQSKAAREARRGGFAQLKAAMQAELAKSAPDLRALAALADQERQQNGDQVRQARAAWLALYDTLSAEQKLTVRDAIKARIARAEALRVQMRGSRGR